MRYAFRLMLIVMILLVLALLVLRPGSPDKVNVAQILDKPSRVHWFGADLLGRDVFSRCSVGLRHSLGVVIAAEAIAGLAGMLGGAFAGRRTGGRRNRSRGFFDAELYLRAQPLLLLLFCLAALLRAWALGMVVALAIFSTMYGLPFYRREFARAFESPWYKGGVSSGASTGHLLGKIVFPMVAPGVMRYAILDMASLVAFEGMLGMVGLTDPAMPSLGRMLYDGRTFLVSAPWLFMAPGLFLMAIVVTLLVISRYRFPITIAFAEEDRVT